MLAQGVARLNAAKTDTPPLTLQIWGDVKRFRYERPALPTKLKIIAEDNGVSASMSARFNSISQAERSMWR